MPHMPKTIAVLFGGNSPEFDVSVVSAQQLMDATDPAKYRVVPVLMDFENRLHIGPHLRNAARYRPLPPGLDEIVFAWGEAGPEIRSLASGTATRIDCVLLVCHGRFGEDGRIQAYLELLGIPFTGFSATNAALAMRKDLTKMLVAPTGVPVLPHVLASRQHMADPAALAAEVGEKLGYPVIVKPASLGSSIGVGIANNADELAGVLNLTLGKDSLALIEPRVPNLVEYNIAVRHEGGATMVSAIERPKPASDLLDFKEKYLSGGGGDKGSTLPSQGMLSLTRDINPEISGAMTEQIHRYARLAFSVLGQRGAPRLDFLCNGKTGELWFNEINPIPGSLGYFLWENAPTDPLLFPELVDHLVSQAIGDNLKQFDDPVPEDARLLPR